MHEFFFADNAGWFTVPAVLGTIFFSIRLLLMVIGGHAGDLHIDVDHSGGDLHHGDPGDAFKLLSVQSIAAFLMGFGWGGVGAVRGTDWSYATCAFVALACGVGMCWLLAVLLKALFDLQSSGNISLDSTVGIEGDVYANVPPRGEGRGQVRLVVNNRQRIFNAVSSGEALNSNTRVRVQSANDDNTITVAPA